ncbi:MAG: D-malate dehydrogenase [decarboxylating] [Verrucomicrobiae bacterium]|nr:D-malate dehydrogenase [decarboxylating] [Verrucomicrobiae bacterium]
MAQFLDRPRCVAIVHQVKKFNIAVYAGDGIGPEVVEQAVRVLAAAQGDCRLEFTHLPWGAEYYEQHRQAVPDDFLGQLKKFDAIFLGALGWPAKMPDHISLAPLIAMRQQFDQYACVRPARLYAGVKTPLANKSPKDIDMVVIRENSEGEYAGIGGRFKRQTADEVAIENAIHSRRGIERIIRFGFETALTRPRRQLTLVTKSNALKHGMVLWDEIFEEVRTRYPSVRSDKQHVDAAAMNFVRCPERFDVVVASNLFGDILTDLGGAIAGGLGLASSANINPERQFPSMFEPVHGSAPDITGKGIANPIAAILSGALMLEFLGQCAAAQRIRIAVESVLDASLGTPDLGGKLTTQQLGEAVVERLNQ